MCIASMIYENACLETSLVDLAHQLGFCKFANSLPFEYLEALNMKKSLIIGMTN